MMVHHAPQSRHMIYVSGRQRKTGEMNGKSGNLNNLVRLLYPEGTPVPLNEVIAVFDADQVRHAGCALCTLWFL